MTQTPVRVLITRTPLAALDFKSQLAGYRSWGLEVELLYLPVQEAELAAGLDRLEPLLALGRGYFAWVSFTSAQGVHALAQYAKTLAGPAVELTQLLAKTRLACVGKATAAALASYGLPTHFSPTLPDAQHMVDQWPLEEHPGPVLCIQGNQARATLVEGLRARGLEVHSATLYRMTSYPAACPLQAAGDPTGLALSLADLPGILNTVDLLVASAPSRLKLVHRYVRERGLSWQLPVLAIGQTTGRCAAELQLNYRVAPSPFPADLAHSVYRFIQEQEEKN
ncbi:MAG: uroporphyrinogen-III synthase [Rothia sp. (in: high G+C Gram-positive bacteria)]|nr:uroporphyrinogen-III synthase [Rothia sp. (in: high G+C Gram-positive bacteria)]